MKCLIVFGIVVSMVACERSPVEVADGPHYFSMCDCGSLEK
ncbi:hypothetical protein PJF56_17615 [Roseofilum sp. BLCC_M91]|uniref:Lipoprotein n=1 Tax=Roseofilum halophilum BLCC-M91 TaxID=3022259 RepID=A0ABT7BNM4_9CYAN|nr:hypothetical protein [Roseofilum halophilum]MDJ1180680.1 hypothetical protein [Roseofilum halophilum BLCC-M91]